MIKLSDLANMSEDEKQQALHKLFNPTPDELKIQQDLLTQEIIEYENKYSMTSESMKFLIRSGQLRETEDHCRWLIVLKILERFKEG